VSTSEKRSGRGPRRPARYFRAGVGAVLVNEQGLVLALERTGVRGAWQLPQGGLEEGEDPEAAVFREIEEETGISRSALTPWARYPELLAYELPPKLQKPKTGMGQVLYWFFFKYAGPPVLELPPDGEFRRASWRSFERIAREVADFRKSAYARLNEFLTNTLV
jgi:putative (di)nucleoside polyphosphate hydrolase